MQYVVFGSDGYIGSYIFQQLRINGFNVVGTSRKTQHVNNVVYYDILNSNIESIMRLLNDKDKAAIICIAESNIDKCYENYDRAYEVNVIKTKKLIDELKKEDFRIIYFSSDNVFDGEDGNYTEQSQTNAINKYGMMKEEMEHYIMKNVPETCIFRLPKVVSISKEPKNIFVEWQNCIEKGNVYCMRGNQLSFVYMDDLYQACVLALEKNLHGLYNIAGDKAYRRADIVREFYYKLVERGAEVHIQECDLEEFSFKDKRPLNISMSNKKFKRATQFKFSTMDAVIEKYAEYIKMN